MATVRITNELKETTQRRAYGLWATRVKDAEVFPLRPEDMFMLVHPYVLAIEGVSQAQFDALPDHYKGVCHQFSIGIINGVQVSTPAFPAKGHKCSPKMTGYYATIHVSGDADWMQKIIDWRVNLNRVMKERDDFVATVTKLLDKHTTLKRALAEWPHLWELLDQTYRDRHNEVVERVKVEATPALDDETKAKLTSSVVASKFFNAGGANV